MHNGTPHCFVSYSWDTEQHRGWVRKLATRLRERGVDAILDQFHCPPSTDLPKFMEKSVRESNFVLLVCTPNFAKKADTGVGGVGYEKVIVTGEIFAGEGRDTKFVPLLREGDAKESLPSYLKSRLFIDFRDDGLFEAKLEELLRHFYDKPLYPPPPIGPQPKWTKRTVAKPAKKPIAPEEVKHKNEGDAKRKAIEYGQHKAEDKKERKRVEEARPKVEDKDEDEDEAKKKIQKETKRSKEERYKKYVPRVLGTIVILIVVMIFLFIQESRVGRKEKHVDYVDKTPDSMLGLKPRRDYMYIVSSSTVYTFAKVVAEQFETSTRFKTPSIEVTGSGIGLKYFCAGVGIQHPDITNASRRIKKSEFEKCNKNGVKEIIEVKIGYDGIVIANSNRAKPLRISRKEVFLALAKDVPDPKGGEKLIPNPYRKWSDISPSLPNSKIEVLGLPPTSGTRDVFEELAMEWGCRKFPWIQAMKKNQKKYKAICHTIREDGGFINAGLNGNFIVSKLDANVGAFGVFGFNFLYRNTDRIQGAYVDGVQPNLDTIASAEYPLSTPPFLLCQKSPCGRHSGH